MAIRYRTLHALVLLLAAVTLAAAWRTGQTPRLPGPDARAAAPAVPGPPAARPAAGAVGQAAPSPAAGGAPTPGAALAGYVTARLGRPYAGDCLDARPPADLGRHCSLLVEQRPDHRAYVLGPVSSQPQVWAFLRRGAAGWSVYATAPFDGAAPGPRPVPWPAPAPPGAPTAPAAGATVEVAGSDGCLPLRREPAGPPVGCLPEGRVATVDGGPVQASLTRWWRLAGLGWAAEPYLRPR